MNCFICNTELKGMNTPLFGATTTIDNQKVCTKCHRNLALKVPNIKYGKSSAEEIKSKYDAYLKKKESENIQKEIANKPLNDLKQKISKINPSIAHKREIKELLNILTPNEIVEKADSGYLKEGKGNTGNGLLVATNYRLIFIDKPMLGFGIKMEDFPYKNISSVTLDTGFLKSVIKIICSGNTAEINLISGAKEFSEFIRRKTFEMDNQTNKQSNIIVEDNILEKIEKLAVLKEKGILTEEEFISQKAKLLEKL